jgi:hypothetical protein
VTNLRWVVALAAVWPAIGAAQPGCPWLNAATAAGVLDGAVHVSVTPASCEFVRSSGGHAAVLRIEVGAVSAPHTACPAGAEPLNAIGNEALACPASARHGWVGEQVTGRVRDQAFLVRIRTNDPSAMPKVLRKKVRDVAEQVAGTLF